MDFGNPKKLRFLTICILFRVLKRLEEDGGGGGGAGISLQTCDTPNEAKVPFLKNQTEDAHLHNWRKRKYDSLTFSIRITFEQVSKQRLKVKNSIKRLLNAIFWLDFYNVPQDIG